MRVLAYELRRLRGLRSTWLLLAAVLLCNATAAAVLASQAPDGPLAAPAGVRLLTAAVPLIPLPFAAFGAGVLGALSYGHEVRHPGLSASQVSYLRRVRLLLAKLLVIGPVAALLALATLLLDALAVHLALPGGVTVAAWAEPTALSDRVSEALAAVGLSGLADLPGAFAPVALVAGHGVPAALLAFVLLTVVAGWTGVLTASLTRSAAAGVLLLCALPALLESGVALLLRRTGAPWPTRAAELLPFQSGIEWAYGWVYGGEREAVAGSTALTDPVLLAAVAAPAVVLLLTALLVQARRRAL
ncbi:hypothetical protein [Kitasatospora sp. NPDC087314]|uniref:hypothetical protein n=1 Tax=Kitasatospora sp. NPDC087314 TaxID=3364068 RepID=UPI00382DC202